MKYYKSECDKLIQFNPETKVYRLRNSVGKSSHLIDVEEFKFFKVREIKKQEFSRLMNEYFKNVKDSWEWEGEPFRKLPNFEATGHLLSANYNIGKDIPYHKPPNSIYNVEKCILVYHWGRVYYHNISYGGYPQGQLIDAKTGTHLRWAQLKHCAPIFNEKTHKIC